MIHLKNEKESLSATLRKKEEDLDQIQYQISVFEVEYQEHLSKHFKQVNVLQSKNQKLKQLYTSFSGVGNSFLKIVSRIGGSSTDFARRTTSSDMLILENNSSANPLRASLLSMAEMKKRSETLPTRRP